MSRRRVVTDDERALFEIVMAGGKSDESKPKSDPLQIDVRPTRAQPRLRPSGVDGRTAERLRKGALEPNATLDLHGMTEAGAHAAVAHFVKNAASRGVRLALIVTGKGRKSSPPDDPFDLELDRRTRGVLNAMVPRWLQEPELVHLVADVRTAHRRHGGSGALYVYLRKERKPA
ncbi:MAG: Smr/MutS family protein [Alphaproteobacteria bacterium]|nr:Smr/MutS family protein [Alphaproteobacteria bacterium]MBV9061574.1 Smr/MutS family protein [Alphaproteobacteria bacterium]